jgi:predicted nucleotidyltransferase
MPDESRYDLNFRRRSYWMRVTLCRMKTVETVPAGRVTVSPEVIADFCLRHHIRRLSLFGSVLRDDFRPESDVDVLVEFKPTHVPGFFGFFEMEEELGKTLGRKVDLNTPNSLSKYFRGRVLAEAVSLHDAA